VSPAREAFYLPLLFLTVFLLGGVRVIDHVALLPPTLFSLVLGLLLIGVLVKSGAVAPERLMHSSRGTLANMNGAVVLITAFFACAQAFNLVTPDGGLPHLLFSVYFLILLLNTIAASPDRVRVIRSLAVIFGSAFVLKFVVLAAISSTDGGRLQRVLLALLEGVTLGTLTQPVEHPVSGYLAFFTLMIFLGGLALLPPRAGQPRRTQLPPNASLSTR
jgi:hypothetical protein